MVFHPSNVCLCVADAFVDCKILIFSYFRMDSLAFSVPLLRLSEESMNIQKAIVFRVCSSCLVIVYEMFGHGVLMMITINVSEWEKLRLRSVAQQKQKMVFNAKR